MGDNVSVLNIIVTFIKSLYNILSELNNIFHMKGVIRFSSYVKLKIGKNRQKLFKSFIL